MHESRLCDTRSIRTSAYNSSLRSLPGMGPEAERVWDLSLPLRAGPAPCPAPPPRSGPALVPPPSPHSDPASSSPVLSVAPPPPLPTLRLHLELLPSRVLLPRLQPPAPPGGAAQVRPAHRHPEPRWLPRQDGRRAPSLTGRFPAAARRAVPPVLGRGGRGRRPRTRALGSDRQQRKWRVSSSGLPGELCPGGAPRLPARAWGRRVCRAGSGSAPSGVLDGPRATPRGHTEVSGSVPAEMRQRVPLPCSL